ncbi:hypothetical protein BC941DRAFT_476934 [Chlamydoabsidia padenii]|nr:hypothetical protein BC941DRAFT_476934 [Chlamydoabsidia padenii]
MVGLGLFFFCCKRQNKRIRKENSFSFKTYIAPHRQQQQQGQQQYAMDNDHYSGNKVLLQNDYYNGGDDDNHQHHQHSSVGMIGTQSTQNTYKSQLSDPFGDHYEVISLANNTNNNNLPTTITPISSNSTFAANGTLDVVLPLVSLDDPQKEDSGVGVGGNGDEPAYEEEFYQVVHPYPPQVADELGLQVGDIVCLAIGFDDGWALGFNVTTGSKGVFPLVCVSLIPPSVLEQLLTSSTSNNNNNNNSNNGEDPMVDGLSTFSSKVLVEEDDSTQEQYHHQQDQQQNQRRLSRSSQLAISIRRIREDMRRSLSLSSSTASYSRHPSPLSAKGSISSKSIRPSSPSPSQAVTTTDIPRRTASMVRSSNNNTTIEYAECESPTSPTHQTPLFNGSNHHLQQQQQQQGSESCEMYHHNHNRLSKQES